MIRPLFKKFAKKTRRLSSAYAHVSTEKPFQIAAVTSMSILTAADLTSQCLEALFSDNWKEARWNWRRTLSLSAFGLLYYGGPCKLLYLRYDQVFRSSFGGNVKKTMFDTLIHTPFLLVPSFYAITGPIKGLTIKESFDKFQNQWCEASTGSIMFWGPTCLFNFWMVPQHSRILVVSIMSFFHKTWLSWVSNRKDLEKAASVGIADSEITPVTLTAPRNSEEFMETMMEDMCHMSNGKNAILIAKDDLPLPTNTLIM